MFLFKLAKRAILLFFLLLPASVNHASAQGLSPYVGLGTATDTPLTSAGCATHFAFDGHHRRL